MKSQLITITFACVCGLGMLAPAGAEPFNDLSQVSSEIRLSSAPGQPTRYDTVSYNARHGKQRAMTHARRGFTDRNGDFLQSITTARRQPEHLRKACDRVIPRGFNDGNKAVNPVC